MGNTPALTSPQSNSKFHKYQTSHNFFIIHITINSMTQDLRPWLSLQQHRKQIYNQPEIFNTQLVRIINDGFCSDASIALFKSEKYTDNIYDQIKKRKQIGRFYQQEEIWYMMLKLVKLTVNIHKNGKKWIIGNVHPKNIFINEDGKIKVISLNSLPYERDHYETYKAQGLSSAFISPELIGFTYNKDEAYQKFPTCVERQVSQVFTIGMTLLSMCMLETNFSNFYDLSYYFRDPRQSQFSTNGHSKPNNHHRKKTVQFVHRFDELVNKKKLEDFIKQIEQRYCSFLGTIIKAMVNPNPQIRLNLQYLYQQVLHPNEDYIQAMNLYWLGEQQLQSIEEKQETKQVQQIHNYQTTSHLY